MPRTSYVIEPLFDRPKAETADPATLQRGNASRLKVRLGLHTPTWKLKTAAAEWDVKSRSATPSALSEFSLTFTYSGLIQISNAIPKSSQCYKMAEEHEYEHEKICVDGTKAALRDCEKILQKQVEAVLKKDYKNDLAKAYADEKAFIKTVAVAAFTEMQDGPFYKVAADSAGIDTPSTYAPIDAACREYAG